MTAAATLHSIHEEQSYLDRVGEHRVIGFTGTRGGLTLEQVHAVQAILPAFVTRCVDLRATPFGRHGDCLGSDDQFHRMGMHLGLGMILHPGHLVPLRAKNLGVFRYPPQNTLQRNKIIVERSWFMLACPGEATEQLRSGTWSTIRYARHCGRALVLILPDGTQRYEHCGTDVVSLVSSAELK